MESSRLLDSARDNYARRQTPSMPLSSGQAYYTVESLEGASSLPPLKTGFATPASLPSDRDALLRLDAQTRALLADRETLDARARLLAAEREAVLRRSTSGPSPADQRPYADGLSTADARTRLEGLLHVDSRLPPVDARTRLDGLPPVDARARHDGLPPVDAHTRLSLDAFQTLDPRARVLPHGLDSHPHDSLWRGARVQPAVGGLAVGAQNQRPFSELLLARELPAGARSGAVPYPSAADSLRAVRDTADVRPRPRRGITAPPSVTAPRPQVERPLPTTMRAPAAVRPVPAETARKQNKGVVNASAPIEKSKVQPAPEQSSGWCAVCKIDCHHSKNLGTHLMGKRHKAAVEGNAVKVNEASKHGKSAPATSQVDKKRASDAKPETSGNAKRQKTSAIAAAGNGVSKSGVADAKKLKVDDVKKENAKKPAAKNDKDNASMPVCQVCNITVTGQQNLQSHLKGKRHAARVKELAGIS